MSVSQWQCRQIRRTLGWVGVAVCALVASGCDDVPPESRGGAGTPAPIKYTNIIGSLGDTPGKFAYPRCIENDGRFLWVIDKSGRVQKIDPDSGACASIFRMPEIELGKPTGFCLAPGVNEKGEWEEGLLYIADTHYHRVMVYRAPEKHVPGQKLEPTLVKQWGKYGPGPGEFYYLTDVAVLLKPGGKAIDRIYVSEYGGNDRISVFDGELKFLFAFGTPGLGEDPKAIEFNRPQSLSIRERSDGSKELMVVDSCNHRVGRFTLDGQLIGWIGSNKTQGRGLGQFYFPYGLALLDDRTALVTEFGGARVQKIDLETGQGLAVYGEPGRNPGQIAAPWAITLLQGRAFLLDSANNRVVEFRP